MVSLGPPRFGLLLILKEIVDKVLVLVIQGKVIVIVIIPSGHKPAATLVALRFLSRIHGYFFRFILKYKDKSRNALSE